MARKSGVRIVLLVEDEAHERFALAVLKKLNFRSQVVRVVPYPKSGRGSGKRHVENKYPTEVRAHRQPRPQNKVLIVLTDADQQNTNQRIVTLDRELAQCQQQARGPMEKIVYWIPKWEVETWILHLNGVRVDEAKSYSMRLKSSDWGDIGARYTSAYDSWRSHQTSSGLPSLDASFHEVNRL